MTVESFWNKKLNELSGVSIQVDDKSVDVFEFFKTTPRTGKACRIDQFDLQLPKRSLFDHLPSMAIQADVFQKYAKMDISEELFAAMIAFHDWHEVIIGDVPVFTPEDLAGKLYMTDEEKEKKKANADEVILKSLSGDLKEEYAKVDAMIHKKDPFFLMVDKTDPIIATWRYIHLFKDKIDIDKFLEAMTHFFTNPKVVPYCMNDDFTALIKALQNKDNAKLYFNEGMAAFSKFYNGKISIDDLKFILGREMHFI